MILMASATDREMLDPDLPGETLIYRLFYEAKPRRFDRISLVNQEPARFERLYQCREEASLEKKKDHHQVIKFSAQTHP